MRAARRGWVLAAALLAACGAPHPARRSPVDPGTGPTPPFHSRTAHNASLARAHGTGVGVARPNEVVPASPTPELIVLVSAHTRGWITPCGCPGSQAGGVARRAAYGELLRARFPGVPVHYVDQGGFMTWEEGVARTTTEAVLEGMRRIGYTAVNAIGEDLPRAASEAAFLSRFLEAPRFSASLRYDDSDQMPFPPYVVLEGAAAPDRTGHPLRVGLLGLASERDPIFAFGKDGRSIVSTTAEEALAEHLPGLRARADLVILLTDARPFELLHVLARHEGIDLALSGEGTDYLIGPEKISGVPVLALGSQGKYLAELRIHRVDGKAALTPIVHWLDERYPEDLPLADSAEATLDRINEQTRAEVSGQEVVTNVLPFVGARACMGCHTREGEIWEASRHARAVASLTGVRRDFTQSCLPCHVTGTTLADSPFQNPRTTPGLVDVQCEACHGPGEDHVRAPSAPYGEAGSAICYTCHSTMTDPAFDFDTRWAAIAH